MVEERRGMVRRLESDPVFPCSTAQPLPPNRANRFYSPPAGAPLPPPSRRSRCAAHQAWGLGQASPLLLVGAQLPGARAAEPPQELPGRVPQAAWAAQLVAAWAGRARRRQWRAPMLRGLRRLVQLRQRQVRARVALGGSPLPSAAQLPLLLVHQSRSALWWRELHC